MQDQTAITFHDTAPLARCVLVTTLLVLCLAGCDTSLTLPLVPGGQTDQITTPLDDDLILPAEIETDAEFIPSILVTSPPCCNPLEREF